MSWFRVRKACRSSSFINLSFLRLNLRFKQKMLIELIPANMIRYVIFYADNKNYHSETINIFAVYLISLATLLKFSGIILVSIDKSDFLLILVPQICLCIYHKQLSASVRKENFQTKNRRRETHRRWQFLKKSGISVPQICFRLPHPLHPQSKLLKCSDVLGMLNQTLKPFPKFGIVFSGRHSLY